MPKRTCWCADRGPHRSDCQLGRTRVVKTIVKPEVLQAGRYELHLSETSPTGYLGVYRASGRGKPYRAKVKENCLPINLGSYQTAVAAAIAVAKCLANKDPLLAAAAKHNSPAQSELPDFLQAVSAPTLASAELPPMNN